jgi:hypothetical protein
MRPATAVENAHRLRRLRRRQQVFGRSSDPYPKYYSPGPTVEASCGTSMCGMRKAIRMKTLLRPSRSG